MNRVTPSLRIESGPIMEVNVTGEKVSKGRLRQLIPVYEERTVDRGLLLEGRSATCWNISSPRATWTRRGDPEQREPEPDRSVIEYRSNAGARAASW